MQTLYSIDTLYPADTVEFCPVDGFTDVLALGTYQLESRRVGRVHLLRVEGDELIELLQLDSDAILDMKWSHQTLAENALLALAKSEASVDFSLLSLAGDQSLTLNHIASHTLQDVNALVLSLDWSNRRGGHPKCAISHSDGGVSILELAESTVLLSHSWIAHDFEAWIVAFDYWNNCTVYSGGDDCKLKVWDVRTDCAVPVLTSKAHTGGVCSIQSNPHKEFKLATGSYDERLLLWDTRQLKRPVNEYQTGGGVWRIKWHPSNANLLLTACMYNGFHIWDTTDNHSTTPIQSYMEHKSIAYGVDWCYQLQKQHLIASCSFYDHALHLWYSQV